MTRNASFYASFITIVFVVALCSVAAPASASTPVTDLPTNIPNDTRNAWTALQNTRGFFDFFIDEGFAADAQYHFRFLTEISFFETNNGPQTLDHICKKINVHSYVADSMYGTYGVGYTQWDAYNYYNLRAEWGPGWVWNNGFFYLAHIACASDLPPHNSLSGTVGGNTVNAIDGASVTINSAPGAPVNLHWWDWERYRKMDDQGYPTMYASSSVVPKAVGTYNLNVCTATNFTLAAGTPVTHWTYTQYPYQSSTVPTYPQVLAGQYYDGNAYFCQAGSSFHVEYSGCIDDQTWYYDTQGTTNGCDGECAPYHYYVPPELPYSWVPYTETENKDGNVTVNPTVNTTYSYSCINGNGVRTSSVTVDVGVPELAVNNVTITQAGGTALVGNNITPDGSTQYDITISASDVGGWNTISHEYALINYQGGAPNQGQYRGFLQWYYQPKAVYSGWSAGKDNIDCANVGQARIDPVDYGPQFMHLVSCGANSVGSTILSITFRVTFDPSFTAPVTNNDISGYAYDTSGRTFNWQNFDTNFGLNLATASFTNTPSCVIASGASSCTASVTYTSANLASVNLTNSAGTVLDTDPSGPQNALVAVPYSGLTLQIRNTAGGAILATTNATASCIAGSTWDGAICVAATPAPSCSTFSVSPSVSNLNTPLTVTWSCQNATSCTAVANGDGFSTGGSFSSSDTATPTATGYGNHYAMNCTGPGDTTNGILSSSFDVISPTVTITALPPRIDPGTSTRITASCTAAVSGELWNITDNVRVLPPTPGDPPVPADANHIVTLNYDTPTLNSAKTYGIVCTPLGGGVDIEGTIEIKLKPFIKVF